MGWKGEFGDSGDARFAETGHASRCRFWSPGGRRREAPSILQPKLSAGSQSACDSEPFIWSSARPSWSVRSICVSELPRPYIYGQNHIISHTGEPRSGRLISGRGRNAGQHRMIAGVSLFRNNLRLFGRSRILTVYRRKVRRGNLDLSRNNIHNDIPATPSLCHAVDSAGACESRT
jgi:hypothetical protein